MDGDIQNGLGQALRRVDKDTTRLAVDIEDVTGITVTVGGIAGDVAHDAADSGSPVKVGGKANAAAPSNVSENDRVNASFTLAGSQRVLDDNSAAILAGVDGVEALITSTNTKLDTVITHVDGIEANQATEIASLSVLDDWDESDRAKVNPIVGVAGVAAGAGAVGTTVQRMTLASDDPAVAHLATIAGDTTDIEAAIEIMDDWDNAASDGASVSGDVAHDAADAGEPIKVGGKALSAEITPVAANDRVNAAFDLVGKQIVLPYANPENFVSGAITTAMTSTTSTSLIAAPAAGLRNYITTIICSNAHATVGTDIIIQDGSGGTTLLTIPAAAVYGGAVVNLPVPLRQPTTATALFCANVTTGASTKVSAVGYKGV